MTSETKPHAGSQTPASRCPTEFLRSPFDFVVSLGYDCHCATQLRKLGLRSCSSPFDWLTGAPLEARLTLLESRFEFFLQREFLQKMEKDPTALQKGNDYYQNIKTGLIFLHDFLESLPFDESLKLVQDKYTRRINRLYENIGAASRSLFVWCDFSHPLSEEQRLTAEKRIQRIFPGKDVFLFVPQSDDDFKRITTPFSEQTRRRTKRMRFLIHCLTWMFPTRAKRSSVRRSLEKRWGLE
jgi:hypothetical protein